MKKTPMKKTPMKSPMTTGEDDVEVVVIALSALNGYEEAVRAFIAGPGPAGHAASTFTTARSGLESARAQREDELKKRRGEVALVTARQQHGLIASEKAELADLFENHLRSLLAGSGADEATFQRALQRLNAAARAAGVTETLLRTLPTALRRTVQDRSTLETNAVDMLLEHLEAHAQAMDDKVAAAVARVREAQAACGEAASAGRPRKMEDLSTLLSREALAEDALAKAESALAALERLSVQADLARCHGSVVV